MLFPKWKLKKGEEDFTIIRIIVEGFENGKPKNFTYNLLDRFDRENNVISMARTTGYTCTAVANLILDGGFKTEGVNAPEKVREGEGNRAYIFHYLKEREVNYTIN